MRSHAIIFNNNKNQSIPEDILITEAVDSTADLKSEDETSTAFGYKYVIETVFLMHTTTHTLSLSYT